MASPCCRRDVLAAIGGVGAASIAGCSLRGSGSGCGGPSGCEGDGSSVGVPSTEGDWPAHGAGPGNTRSNLAGRSPEAGDPSTEVAWEYYAGDGRPTNPLLVAESAYIVTGRAIHAIDLATGDAIWRHDFPTAVGELGYHDGRLLAGTADGCLFGLAPSSGCRAWASDVSDRVPEISGLRAVGDRVFLWSRDPPRVAALDLSTRDGIWDVTPGPSSLEGMAYADARVVLTGRDETVALDDESGAVRWRRGADGRTQYAPPVAIDGSVAIATGGDGIQVLSLDDGTRRWRSDRSIAVYETPGVAGGTIFATADGSVWRGSLEDGTVQRLTPRGYSGGGQLGAPVRSGTQLYVPTGGPLLAMDLEGVVGPGRIHVRTSQDGEIAVGRSGILVTAPGRGSGTVRYLPV